MLSNEEYVEEGERFDILILGRDSCSFEGNLFQRKAGGFDLYLFRDNSEFECLELDKITWLRQQAPDGSLFIERFAEANLDRNVKRKIETAFARWLDANLGLTPGGKYKSQWASYPE